MSMSPKQIVNIYEEMVPMIVHITTQEFDEKPNAEFSCGIIVASSLIPIDLQLNNTAKSKTEIVMRRWLGGFALHALVPGRMNYLKSMEAISTGNSKE